MQTSTGGKEPPILLRVSEATALTRLGRTTLYALIASGEIPVFRCGRAIRVPRTELEAWIARQTDSGKALSAR